MLLMSTLTELYYVVVYPLWTIKICKKSYSLPLKCGIGLLLQEKSIVRYFLTPTLLRRTGGFGVIIVQNVGHCKLKLLQLICRHTCGRCISLHRIYLYTLRFVCQCNALKRENVAAAPYLLEISVKSLHYVCDKTLDIGDDRTETNRGRLLCLSKNWRSVQNQKLQADTLITKRLHRQPQQRGLLPPFNL